MRIKVPFFPSCGFQTSGCIKISAQDRTYTHTHVHTEFTVLYGLCQGCQGWWRLSLISFLIWGQALPRAPSLGLLDWHCLALCIVALDRGNVWFPLFVVNCFSWAEFRSPVLILLLRNIDKTRLILPAICTPAGSLQFQDLFFWLRRFRHFMFSTASKIDEALGNLFILTTLRRDRITTCVKIWLLFEFVLIRIDLAMSPW